MEPKNFFKRYRLFFVKMLVFFVCLFCFFTATVNACMVGCAAGSKEENGQTIQITEDGRPLLWKILNLVKGGNKIKQLYYVKSNPLNYIVLTYDSGNKPGGYTVGLNEAGVSVVYAINSWSKVDDTVNGLAALTSHPEPYPEDSLGKPLGGYGHLQKYIIENCRTVDSVEKHLKKSFSNYQHSSGLYCVIDGSGNVLSFETTDTAYKLYYPNGKENVDTRRAGLTLPYFDDKYSHITNDNLKGFIVRSNRLHWMPFSQDRFDFIDPPPTPDKPGEYGRFDTGTYNVLGMIYVNQTQLSPLKLFQGDGLPLNSIEYKGFEFLRYGNGYYNPITGKDHSSKPADPEINRPLKSLALGNTNAGMVIHGVKKNEDPLFSTLWLTPGHTDYGIAVPVWVTVKDIPYELNSKKMTSCILDLRNYSRLYPNLPVTDHNTNLQSKHDNFEQMIQKTTFPFEKYIYNEVNGNEKLMTQWRREGSSLIVTKQMERVERQISHDAFSVLNWFKLKYDSLNCIDENCPILSNSEINDIPKISITQTHLNNNKYKFTANINDNFFMNDEIIWNLGDGTVVNKNVVQNPGKLAQIEHEYQKPGNFLVSCTITDNDQYPISNTAWVWVETPKLIEQWDFNDRVYENGFKSSLKSGDMLLKNNNTITSTDLNTVSEYDKAAIVNTDDLLEYANTSKLASTTQWSLLMDVYYDADAPDPALKRALFQTDISNSGAAECWISRQKHLGSEATGFSKGVSGTINPGEWNRIVFTVDLIGGTYNIYLNGTSILTKTVDANSSLYNDLKLGTKLLFFTDGLKNDSADNPIKVSKIAIFDGALKSEEVRALGTADNSL